MKSYRIAFNNMRSRARQRSIEFRMSYEEWLKVWQDSGHFHERGRGGKNYVMARHGDKGAYEVGNVYICTGRQNAADASVNGCYANSRARREASAEELAANRAALPIAFPSSVIAQARTYREAVRLSWQLRRIAILTIAQLTEEAGLTRQHVTDYLHEDDKPARRDLPADKVADFERVVGNSIVSQWLASQSRLTVLEQMQANALAEAA